MALPETGGESAVEVTSGVKSQSFLSRTEVTGESTLVVVIGGSYSWIGVIGKSVTDVRKGNSCWE